MANIEAILNAYTNLALDVDPGPIGERVSDFEDDIKAAS